MLTEEQKNKLQQTTIEGLVGFGYSIKSFNEIIASNVLTNFAKGVLKNMKYDTEDEVIHAMIDEFIETF